MSSIGETKTYPKGIARCIRPEPPGCEKSNIDILADLAKMLPTE